MRTYSSGMFSKKHYETLAAVMREQVERGANKESVSAVVDSMVSRFRADNPAFQPDRFRKACGL
jgi:hypothetical protein